jgi:hypothetical protein
VKLANDLNTIDTKLGVATSRLNRGIALRVGVESNAKSFPADAAGLAGLFGEILDDFMREDFLPNAVLPQFDRGRGHFRTHRARNIEVEDRGSMQSGLSALRDRISQTRGPRISGGHVRVGLGEGVGDMRLSRYTEYRPRDNARSPYNSFFWAVEMGTGIHSDPEFRRTEGRFKESDGSWWLGPQRGVGVHFEGTKGMHFLAEGRRRMPKAFYYDFVGKRLPHFAARAIKRRFSR